MKRALLSVSDKTGLMEFALELEALGFQIVSTGGTKVALEKAGASPLSISDVTLFPEIMDGRVKTLHPNVHGALLCDRGKKEHIEALEANGIQHIDLVCVNLYPFISTLEKPHVSAEEIIENIDIGGPSMLRSAAKNYKWITVLCDPTDYIKVLEEIKSLGETTLQTREYLAAKVFRHTAAYDSHIAEYLTAKTGASYPETLTITYEKAQDLRYGENPHQQAAFYKKHQPGYSLASCRQLQGKELSYNNIQDASAALDILEEYQDPCVVAVKHMNPCGIGEGETIYQGWQKAYAGDETSIFGGIVALNRLVDEKTAEEMSRLFLEIIIAPEFSPEALAILSSKKNLRLLTLDLHLPRTDLQKFTWVSGGLLIQDTDQGEDTDFRCVTDKKPTEEMMRQLLFAYKAVKHVKSNAIVLAKDHGTVGVGAGQMNRVGAAKIALEQAGEKAKGSVLASDAFFPMPDTVELAASFGVQAIIQPGGSIQDQQSIDACNRLGIAMIFTGRRHFKH